MRPEQVPARPECPEPHRWIAPDSDATEIDVTALIVAFVIALKPDYVVETGTYRGDTTKAIGRALRFLGIGHLLSIDIEHDRVKQAKDLVFGMPVTVICGKASEVEPTQPIDLLFIDCELIGRLAQLRHFKPYASPRCVILMHDTALPNLSHDIDELYRVMDLSEAEGLVQPWVKLPTPRGLAITRYC